MKKSVNLKITSTQYIENLKPSGEAFRRELELEDSMEILTEGTVYSRNNATYITYDEAEALSKKKRMEEFMFLGLRMTEGILEDDFLKTFGVPVDSVYLLSVESLISEKLLKRAKGRLFLTELGADLSNYALSKFLLDKD